MSRRAWLLLGVFACAPPLAADVHLSRRADGSAVIFNDSIGSGWRVNGKAPSDAYLVAKKNAPSPYDEAIRSTASQHGVDPQLVKSVMLVESNFNPYAVSRKGARGLMQLMPQTARSYGVANVHSAGENIRGGVRYLADLLATFRGDVPLALAAYNAGEGAVTRYSGVPPYPETQEYVRRVMVAYNGTPGSWSGLPASSRPVLDGGFRGTPVRSEPVTVVTGGNGAATLLSNDGVPLRQAPLLGRVR